MVRVDAAGTYAINAKLVASDGTEIAQSQQSAPLAAGDNSFELSFDGDAIAASGQNGPYRVQDLSVYAISDVDLAGYLVNAHQTAAYTAEQFGALDTTAPGSQAGPLNALYTASSVAVPYVASDDASGIAQVELWARHRPNEAQPWSAWALAATATSSPISYTFAIGDGNYEFFSIAIDGAGNREVPPAVADVATRRDAVDDPPDYAWSTLSATWSGQLPPPCDPICPQIAGDQVVLTGTATAAHDRGVVSVRWRLYAVVIDEWGGESRSLIRPWTTTTPADGAFDERVEDFSIYDARDMEVIWSFYDIEIEIKIGNKVKLTRTDRVPIVSTGS